MVLSKRERILAIGMILVFGALLLNEVVNRALLKPRQKTTNEKLELEAQLAEAQSVFTKKKNLERKWKGLLSEETQGDAGAESRVARALDEWARQARLTLSSVKPDRSTTDKGLSEITFAVAGRGSLDAVASFLYRVETSELPVKVVDMQLGSSNESGDSMSLTLRISSIYLGAPSKAAEKTQQKQLTEANDEDQML